MENGSPSTTKPFIKMTRSRKFSLRRLRLSLKFRPEVLRLILRMRRKIRKKAQLFVIMKQQLKNLISSKTTTSTSTQTEMYTEDLVVKCHSNEEKTKDCKSQNVFTQTDELIQTCVAALSTDIAEVKEEIQPPKLDGSGDLSTVSDKNGGWSLSVEKGENEKSIAEQVKEVAQSAMQQSGMVYVESAGMYYDYKTGYYYSAELGLYYHPDTGCYYSYSEDKQTFVFHSYPDRSKTATNPMYEAHEKKKARKLARARKREETDIDNLTKNLSQGKEENTEHKRKAKRRKRSKEKIIEDGGSMNKQAKVNTGVDEKLPIEKGKEVVVEKESVIDDEAIKNEDVPQDLEEGECSESDDEKEVKKEEDVETDESDASTISDIDDSIAKHHPPCMRVIVRETNLPKLKVGSLFVVTKDGGTVGREGSEHTIILEDSNVSRRHLDIKYDMKRKSYTITDLGSKNGTTLNGVRISESQVTSEPVEVMHGSTIQLGETKLLCHIHSGTDTCGHCEPGLVMEAQEKEKKAAYTRTCSVQKQHELELARLKNKYAPKPLAIEETAYNDRAKERRAKVGSSHHSEKTQSSDLETFIAPENKGFKLLEKMGWSKGEGLGKDNQGDTEPIPIVSNENKSGLGTTGAVSAPAMAPSFAPKNSLGPSTMRLAAKTNMLRPPAKVFQDSLEEDSE